MDTSMNRKFDKIDYNLIVRSFNTKKHFIINNLIEIISTFYLYSLVLIDKFPQLHVAHVHLPKVDLAVIPRYSDKNE